MKPSVWSLACSRGSRQERGEVARRTVGEHSAGRQRCVGEVEGIQCGNSRALKVANVAGHYRSLDRDHGRNQPGTDL